MAKRLSYSYKLAKLRAIVDRFDAKKLDGLDKKKTRTAASKKARASELRKVSAAFSRIRPFIHGVHTVVKVRDSKSAADRLEELRKYSGVPRLKGLRAIPVKSIKAGRARVKFDKKNRPTIKEAGHGQKIFRFSRMPKSGDDAIELLEELLPELPQGIYFLATRHHFLIHSAYERGQLVSGLRAFVYGYAHSPEFIRLIYGVKWVSGSTQRVFKVMREVRTERGRQKLERNRLKSEKAARQIATMHKRLSRPKMSERARKTGRR